MREASGALFNTDAVMRVDQALVDELKARAFTSPTGRFRLCLHHSPDEPVQQMLVVHRRGNYSRPHRQDASKMFTVIEGELLVLIFDEQGGLAERIAIKPPGQGESRQGESLCVRLAPGVWHTMFALTDPAVFCEILAAPNPDGNATEYPAWSPAESDASGVAEFLARVGLS